jgi:hypothetical protein
MCIHLNNHGQALMDDESSILLPLLSLMLQGHQSTMRPHLFSFFSPSVICCWRLSPQWLKYLDIKPSKLRDTAGAELQCERNESQGDPPPTSDFLGPLYRLGAEGNPPSPFLVGTNITYRSLGCVFYHGPLYEFARACWSGTLPSVCNFLFSCQIYGLLLESLH